MAHAAVVSPKLATIHILIGGIHESNHDYIAQRLREHIDGLINCCFLDKENNLAEISYDSNQLDQFALLSSIQRLGHPVQMYNSESVQAQLRIEGMHCNSCVMNICDAVRDLPGVIDIELTFLDKLATVTFDPSILNLPMIISEIEKLNFQVAIYSAPQARTTTSEPTTTSMVSSVTPSERLIPAKEKTRSQSALSVNNEFETCYLTITGMTCASCVDNIQRQLSKVEGSDDR